MDSKNVIKKQKPVTQGLRLAMWLGVSCYALCHGTLSWAQESVKTPPAPPAQEVLADPNKMPPAVPDATQASGVGLTADPGNALPVQASGTTEKPAEAATNMLAPTPTLGTPTVSPTPDALVPAMSDVLPPVAPAPTSPASPDIPASAPPTMPLPANSALEDYLKQDGLQQQAPTTEDQLPVTARVTIRGEGFDLGADNTVSISSDDPDQPLSQIEAMESIRSEAFDAAMTGLFPLKPEEIEGLLQRYDQTERAAQTPPYAQPKPQINVQTISLDPGVMPPSIRTAAGNVTTVNILDMTGAPWPVQDITWAGDFEIIQPEEGGHIIRITPSSKFAIGNMVVRLLTLKTPITFSLKAERDVVDYRVDARIPEYGPFAEPQLIDGGAQLVAGSPTLTSILDGVAPTGSTKLQVSGVDGRTTAYKLSGTTYVRTPLTLLSPGWQSSVSSADGMNVYALSDTPVLLLSDAGKFQRAKLSEKQDVLDE
ncbi:MAG: type IV secretion protein DotH [Alphaproteobacteria bacterium]|nr:type IV secretion protein DotH [Alphaproteobacteria bacterium]